MRIQTEIYELKELEKTIYTTRLEIRSHRLEASRWRFRMASTRIPDGESTYLTDTGWNNGYASRDTMNTAVEEIKKPNR